MKEKKVNFEILRIISMLMIISLHFFLHCSIPYLKTLNSNFVYTWSVEAISYVSVNIFILLTVQR